jgi:hypothetical protein
MHSAKGLAPTLLDIGSMMKIHRLMLFFSQNTFRFDPFPRDSQESGPC